MSTPDVVFYRERDNFEAELKELKRRYEAVDLSHAAVTRERDTLSKEVHHTDAFLIIPSKSFFHGSVLIVFCFFKCILPSCPPGGNIATISDTPAEGQGVPAQAECGTQCSLCT